MSGQVLAAAGAIYLHVLAHFIEMLGAALKFYWFLALIAFDLMF
jgi:hypothetical protein